jgi:hypothetical protein
MPAQARRPLYLLKLMLVAPIDLAATFTPSKIWPDSTSCCCQALHVDLILSQAGPANPRA